MSSGSSRGWPAIRESRSAASPSTWESWLRCGNASTRVRRSTSFPVDADDLVEEDALEVLEAVLAGTPADFAYSDEDILSDDGALARYSRPDFDPVLNLETSYIWHLCAFRRERALELGVYSNRGAEFCHDWDTVIRFAADRASIIHIPHVLYRWRTHAVSQSHSGVTEPGLGGLDAARAAAGCLATIATRAVRASPVSLVSRRRRVVHRASPRGSPGDRCARPELWVGAHDGARRR